MAINEIKHRSFGEDISETFILYMFQDEVDEIKRFTLESHEPQGCLLGLWTNSRNPVVHVVQMENIFNESYTFLKNHQSNADKIFTRIGHWRFSQTDRVRFTNQETRDWEQGLIYLEVTKTEGEWKFLPKRSHKGKVCIGLTEILAGQNPFKISKQRKDEESSYDESTGKVAKLVVFFEGNDETQLCQWYERDNGVIALRKIHTLLEEITSQSVEIERDLQNLNLLLRFMFDSKHFRLDFPSNFPERHARLKIEANNSIQCMYDIKSSKPRELVEEAINYASME